MIRISSIEVLYQCALAKSVLDPPDGERSAEAHAPLHEADRGSVEYVGAALSLADSASAEKKPGLLVAFVHFQGLAVVVSAPRTQAISAFRPKNPC